MHLLARFIRDNKHDIIADWMREVADLPSATAKPGPILRDHVPMMLDSIAATLDAHAESPSSLESSDRTRELARRHARDRLNEGFDLQQVVAEYRILRQSILKLFRERGPISEESKPRLGPLANLNEVLDLAIADSVEQYAADRARAAR